MEHELEESLALYRRRRDELGEFQRRMGEVRATVTAPRRVVSVTVGSQGQIEDLAFPTMAYRNMTPAELSAAIRTTIAAAREAALDQAAALLSPMLPAGLDANALVRGTADLGAVLPEDPTMPMEPAVRGV